MRRIPEPTTLQRRWLRSLAFLPFLALIACAVSVRVAGDDRLKALREKVANELRRQDAAWDDLTVRFSINDVLKDAGAKEFVPGVSIRGLWVVTKNGQELVRRETVRSPGGGRDGHVQAASFDGEFYMDASNQKQGSGGVGHRISSFLMTSDSPKGFGLAVTGLELSMPMSVQEFVRREQVTINVDATTDTVVVEGADPLADGFHLRLVLSPVYGFRPIRIESRDSKGLYTTWDIKEYQEVVGIRGSFWFPKRVERHGYRPSPREVGTISTFSLDKIECDRHPDRREFRFSYPRGALIVSSDTGEGFYLTADSTPEDVPGFKGKQMSYREHDSRDRLQSAPPPRRRHLLLIANVVILAFVGAAAIYWLRKGRKI